MKGGATAGGQRAAASHTGSLATDDRVFDGVCRQAGITRAATVEEAFEAAATFATQPLPRGPASSWSTTAGGWGVVTADAITATATSSSPPLPDDLRAAIDDEAAAAVEPQQPGRPRRRRDARHDPRGDRAGRRATPTSTRSSTSGSASSRTRRALMRDGPLLSRTTASSGSSTYHERQDARFARRGRGVGRVTASRSSPRPSSASPTPTTPAPRRPRVRPPRYSPPTAPRAHSSTSGPTRITAAPGGDRRPRVTCRLLIVLLLVGVVVCGVLAFTAPDDAAEAQPATAELATQAGRRAASPSRSSTPSARRGSRASSTPPSTAAAATRASPSSRPRGRLPSRSADTPFLGVSTQKLMTAAAALAVLGPDSTFTTRVVAPGEPANGSVDKLFLVGGGDPLLSTADFRGLPRRRPQDRRDTVDLHGDAGRRRGRQGRATRERPRRRRHPPGPGAVPAAMVPELQGRGADRAARRGSP